MSALPIATSDHVCKGCGGGVPILVEGSDMCLPCDIRYYPAAGLPGPFAALHLHTTPEEHTMTDTATITPEQRLTVVKHLATGKNPDVVATITKLSRGAVVDIGSHHGYPDTEKLCWAADILTKKITDGDAPTEDPRRETRAQNGTRVTTTSQPGVTASPVGTAQLTKPDEIRILLNTAKAHPSKRIQHAADRVFDQIGRLRDLIRDDEEKNAEKRRHAAEKEAARAEVKRLEEQLAEARAKLRGPKPDAPNAHTPGENGDGPSSKEIRSWAKATGVECPPVGRVPAAVRAAYDEAHREAAAS